MHNQKQSLCLFVFVALMGMSYAQESMPSLASSSSARQNDLEGIEVTASKPVALTQGSAETGYQMDSLPNAGPFRNLDLQKTPYSLHAVSGELIENFEAHTPADALKAEPAVYVSQVPLNNSGGTTNMYMRGFKYPVCLKDGLYANAINMPTVEGVERIEVLSGLSGFLYPYTFIGGAINYVTKKPTKTPVTTISMGHYGGRQNYSALDWGGPIDDEKRLAFRLTGFKGGGDTYLRGAGYFDRQNNATEVLSAQLDYQVTSNTILNVNVYRNDFAIRGLQTQFKVNPSKGIDVPSASDFDQTTLYGQPWTMSSVKSNQAGFGFETGINQHFSIRGKYNYSDMVWKERTIFATLLDNDGNYSESYFYYRGPQHYRTHTGYLYLDANFSTFHFFHNLTLGYWGTNEVDHDGETFTVDLGTSNIHSPATIAQPDSSQNGDGVWSGNWATNALLISDQIRFNQYLSFYGGLNEMWIFDKYHDLTVDTVLGRYSQFKLSPSASLVFSPWNEVSTYISYMEGLEEGGSAPDDAANAGEVFAPFADRQYEIGLKAKPISGMNVDVALFRIDKVNEYTDPDDNVYKQAGRQVHQGAELTLGGRFFDQLTLKGGFTYLNAEVEKQKDDPDKEGKIPVNVPEKQGKLYMEYAFPWFKTLAVSSTVSYIGRRPVDVYNLGYIPSVTLWDGGLRYQTKLMNHPLQLSAAVSNILDKSYWAEYSNKGLELGSPRLLSLSIRYSL